MRTLTLRSHLRHLRCDNNRPTPTGNALADRERLLVLSMHVHALGELVLASPP